MLKLYQLRLERDDADLLERLARREAVPASALARVLVRRELSRIAGVALGVGHEAPASGAPAP